MSKSKTFVSLIWPVIAVLIAAIYWLWTQTTLLSQQINQTIDAQKISLKNSALLSQQMENIDQVEKALSRAEKQQVSQYLQSEQVIELLELADRRLKLDHDPSGAIQALTLAQQAIGLGLKTEWHGLLLSINKHIETLSSTNNAIQTQLLAINDLSKTINNLPVTTEKMADKPVPSSEHTGEDWKARGKNILKKLIVIRRLEEMPNRHNTPEELRILRQRALLNLDLARWGLLQGQPKLSQESLKIVEDIISIQIQFSTEAREKITDKINKLSEQIQTTSLPSLTQLIQSAQQLQSILPQETP